MKRLTYMLLATFLLFSTKARPQQYYLDEDDSEIRVEGTSTLHDWHSSVMQMTGSANLTFSEGTLTGIEEMIVSASVTSLKSDKNAMDKKAHEALLAEKFPFIKYLHTRVDEITGNKISSMGLLTIAGLTREVTMNVSYTNGNSAFIEFEGKLELKMTDFGIDPPTALLGSLKTGDDIVIHFKARFKQ